MRADWRQQIGAVAKDLGMQMVRFHGILDDDMSVVMPNGSYSFFNVDFTFDYLLSIGIRPIVELSFMPNLLASGNLTVFYYEGNITPPSNWTAWNSLITGLVQHLVERYGVDEVRNWRFEVWNEPNCGFYIEPNCCGDGCGNQTGYFQLYQNTAMAVKSVDSQLLVGGPATAQCQWIPDFLNFVQTNNVPADFVSSHLYPTDPEVPQTRDGFRDYVAQAAQQAAAGGLPLLLTEFNSGLGINVADNPYTASFAVYLAQAMQTVANLELFSFWTFSDIFEEQGFDSTPFLQKFGLNTIYNIPKPGYRGFQILHELGDQSYNVTGPVNTTIVVLCITSQGSKHIDLVLANWNYYDLPIADQNVTVMFNNAPGLKPDAALRRIDNNHAYAVPVWQAAGAPVYPTQSLLNQMLAASQLQVEPIKLNVLGQGQYSVTLTVPAYGVADITIDYA